MKIIREEIIEQNINRIKQFNDVILVLKDQAYGFGLERVVKLALKQGLRFFAVRSIEEAETIASITKEANILIIGKVERNILKLSNPQFIMTINDFSDYLFCKEYSIRAHLAIDVGMNRFGMKSGYLAMINDPLIEAIYTHVYAKDVVDEKIELIESIATRYHKKYHIGGSMVFGHTNAMIRVGRLAYENALILEGKILLLKTIEKNETVGYDGSYIAKERKIIAVCNIGYVNGLYLYYHGCVMIRQKRYPVIGRCCMDQCFVLVDEMVEEGDSVEFFGESISEDYFCYHNHMSKYELFLQIH